MVIMKYLLLASLLFIGVGANAQSLFKPLPKPANDKVSQFARSLSLSTTTPLPDSTFKGFRFTGPMVLYALPNSTIFTGIGFDFESDVYNSTTQKWSTTWAIAIGGYEGGQIAPSNVSAVTAVGLSVSFLNKLITVGILYNLSNKNFQGALGPQVNLIN
jgi:hypothetical protein